MSWGLDTAPPINPDYPENDWRSRYPSWWHAIIGRDINALKRLLDDGLDPSSLVPAVCGNNVDACTSPLAYIVGSCHCEMLKIAVPYCSDLSGFCSHLQDGRSHTPLQRAAMCRTHWEMARILIDNGAMLPNDLVENAQQWERSMFCPPPGTTDRVIYDFYHHVQRMRATAWCMRQIGDAWPDMIEIAVRDRMGNDEFATDIGERSDEEEESSSSSSSGMSNDDDDDSSYREEEEEDAGPRKRQKM